MEATDVTSLVSSPAKNQFLPSKILIENKLIRLGLQVAILVAVWNVPLLLLLVAPAIVLMFGTNRIRRLFFTAQLWRSGVVLSMACIVIGIVWGYFYGGAP